MNGWMDKRVLYRYAANLSIYPSILSFFVSRPCDGEEVYDMI